MARRTKTEDFWETLKGSRLTELAAQVEAEERREEEERQSAPVVAKNVLLALLSEARRTRWIALVSLGVSVAALLVVAVFR